MKIATLTVALLLAAPSAAQEGDPPAYEIVPLAGLQGVSLRASALNDRGEVAGQIFDTGPPEAEGGGPPAAFLWRDGVVFTREFPGQVIHVADVSDTGHVVGTVREPQGSTSDVFVWHAATDDFQLVDPGVEVELFPHAVDDAGRVIVGSDADGLFGFAFDLATGAFDAIAFGAPPAQGVGTQGTLGINAHGVAVGAEVVFDEDQGFFVELPYRWTTSGGIEELETPVGGFGGRAVAVNDAGNVAGIVLDEFFGQQPAFWIEGGETLTTIGVPFGYFVADPTALNDHDQIVLVAPNDLFGFTRGFLWEDGVFTDLSEFAPPGLFVSRPHDLNDCGEILVELTDAGGLSVAGYGVLRPTAPIVAAAEVSRTGTPPNPDVLRPGATSGPVVGETWDPFVDHTRFVPDAVADFVIVSPSPLELDLGFAGTLLCNLPFLATVLDFAPFDPFAIPIPDDCDLVGLELCVQGGSSPDGALLLLTNALDITVGS